MAGLISPDRHAITSRASIFRPVERLGLVCRAELVEGDLVALVSSPCVVVVIRGIELPEEPVGEALRTLVAEKGFERAGRDDAAEVPEHTADDSHRGIVGAPSGATDHTTYVGDMTEEMSGGAGLGSA